MASINKLLSGPLSTTFPLYNPATATASTTKKRTNPLLAAPVASLKSNNPFVISQTPSADLFGLNIPV